MMVWLYLKQLHFPQSSGRKEDTSSFFLKLHFLLWTVLGLGGIISGKEKTHPGTRPRMLISFEETDLFLSCFQTWFYFSYKKSYDVQSGGGRVVLGQRIRRHVSMACSSWPFGTSLFYKRPTWSLLFPVSGSNKFRFFSQLPMEKGVFPKSFVRKGPRFNKLWCWSIRDHISSTCYKWQWGKFKLSKSVLPADSPARSVNLILSTYFPFAKRASPF